MKTNEVLKSYQAISELLKLKMHYKTAKNLAKIKKQLHPHFDLFQEVQTKLIEDKGLKKYMGAGGMLRIPPEEMKDDEKVKKIINDFNDLEKQLKEMGNEDSEFTGADLVFDDTQFDKIKGAEFLGDAIYDLLWLLE